MKYLNKKYLIISLLFLFIACINNEERIGISSIDILIRNQHPFLVDHSRFLSTNNSKNKEIDIQKIHDDVDGHTKAYLFEDINNYIVVDADGKWYYIEKETGKIRLDTSYDPFVRKKLPEKYIGTFIYDKKNNKYELKIGEVFEEKTMYKFGGG